MWRPLSKALLSRVVTPAAVGLPEVVVQAANGADPLWSPVIVVAAVLIRLIPLR